MNPFRRISDLIDPADGMLKDSDYPEDMCRNEAYLDRNPFKQFVNVYRTQLKLYSKDITTLGLYAFILAIPILAISKVLDGFVFDRYLRIIGDTGETYSALCLGLLTLMMVLVASIVCGNILPNEFRSRTAYLNLPFPQSRSTFYFGKFLAGLTVVLSIVIAAFAMVIFVSTWAYGSVSMTAMTQALVIALAGTFACCSTAYGLSAFLSRSSTMMPFIVMFMILPMVGLLLADIESVSGIVGYLPCFSGDVALARLGSTYSVSISYLFSDAELFLSCKPVISVAVSLAWGIVFLIVGFNRIVRREM